MIDPFSHRGRRKSRPALISLSVLCAVILAGTGALATGETEQSGLSLGSSLPKHEVVRCLLGEGRIVIRYQEQLSVLRVGDTLPGSTAKVTEITRQRVVIIDQSVAGADPEAEIPELMLIITRNSQGRLELTEISRRPDERRIPGVALAPQAPKEEK